MIRQVHFFKGIAPRHSFSDALRLRSCLPCRHYTSTVINEADPSSVALWKAAKPFKEIPGPKPYPVFGSIPTIVTKLRKGDPFLGLTSKWHQEYGPVYKLDLIGASIANLRDVTISTTDPEVLKVMMRNETKNKKYPSRGEGLENKMAWIHDRINIPPFMFFTGGQEWKTLRSAMVKPITPRRVAMFSEQLYDAADQLGTRWLNNKGADSFISDIRDDVQKWALKGVTWFTFNEDLSVFDEHDQMAANFAKASINFINNVAQIVPALPVYRFYPTVAFKNYKKAVIDLHALGEKMMKSRFEQLQKLAKEGEMLSEERISVMEHLLIEGKLTKEQALSQACDLLAAGVDTTSSTATFLLHLVSKEPELQQAIYDEVTSICGLNGVPDFNDLQKMPLVRNCVKETLRMYPPVFLFTRASESDMVIHGYQVPKKTIFMFNINEMSKDPEFYEYPHQFDPYRWKGKKEQDELVSFANLPFGAGVRMCYGRRLAELELHLLLANLCRRFFLSTDQSSLTTSMQSIMKAGEPVRLQLMQRHL